MRKTTFSLSLALVAAGFCLAMTGCTIGENALSKAPLFSNSDQDYSSQLESLQARDGGSAYTPRGGFDAAPNHAPLFSMRKPTGGGHC